MQVEYVGIPRDIHILIASYNITSKPQHPNLSGAIFTIIIVSTVISRMPPQQPALSNSSSTNSLSSWPVIKYSYSASSISTSIQPPWAHFTHRDNVFLVIDTQRVRGYIQDDGKFSDHQTRLKIVWGVETLVRSARSPTNISNLDIRRVWT